MKDNKEIRALNPEEEKDVSGGMTENLNISINTIKPTMLEYGGPSIKPEVMYGGPSIKPITTGNPFTKIIKKNPEFKSAIPGEEELIPNNSENEKNGK